MKHISYQTAIALFRKDLQNCPPNESIVIEFEDEFITEDDYLIASLDYPSYHFVIEADSEADVQYHLEKWREYRKAYHEAWGESIAMRRSLIDDPYIPRKAFKKYWDDRWSWSSQWENFRNDEADK